MSMMVPPAALRGLDEICSLLGCLVDVVKQVVRVDVDLPGSDADEVIVGIDDAEGVGRNVAIDGTNDGHWSDSSLTTV